MHVTKRNNTKEPVSYDKVINRIKKLTETDVRFTKLEKINVHDLAKNIIMKIVDGIHTIELDNQAITACMSVSTKEPEYSELAKRIYVSSFHKSFATETFYETAVILKEANLLNHIVFDVIENNKELINNEIVTFRDYSFDYFGLKTLEKGYLLKVSGIIETPQFLFMRVALGLHKTNLTEAFKTYHLLSQKLFTHATPTLFNSGTIREQNSSCFLLGTEDSLEGIMKTYTDCAKISKWAGGLGIHISNIRSRGSLIRKTNGKSDGIIPMMKVYNELSRYINQGGKRNGSFAMYLEPHHADIVEFLKVKNGNSDKDLFCQSLFTALWISNHFMECVQKDTNWYLMCPDACPGLTDVYGSEYTKLYQKYVSEKKFVSVLKAQDLFKQMLNAQTISGSPYVLFKDHINEKSNQKNIGVIKSSNLCVAPETKILTSTGYHHIGDLENKTIKVWNGSEFSETIVRKTSDHSELMRVTFNNGTELDCTLEHNFYIKKTRSGKGIKVQAKNLSIGDTLIDCKFPIINDTDFSWEKDISLLEQVPFGYNIDTKNMWLSHWNYILGTDFCFMRSSSWEFLMDVKLLLNTVGKYGIVSEYHYNTTKYILVLSEYVDSVSVSSISFIKKFSETFCFTESFRGTGIFNGIIAGNCAEITLVSDSNTHAVCNLASICLGKFQSTTINEFGFYINEPLLKDTVSQIVRNLNQVIDCNFYPTEEAEFSNKQARPIGIGVQGLANLFYSLKIPFDSQEAKELNKYLFESIQYFALEESCKLARKFGMYSKFKESPSSKGTFQHNMWNISEDTLFHDWDTLRLNVIKYGLRNSTVTALPPTASTSQIMGNFESFEPIHNNIFIRSTLSGNFPVVNQYLVQDLKDLNIWSSKIRNMIVQNNGSIQTIKEIPDDIKKLYKTVFEIKCKDLIDLSADRAPFIDQSQSLNLYMKSPDQNKMYSALFYGWKRGLKTGMYYFRIQQNSDAMKFTLGENEDEDICLSCSA